ncbi:MAG: Type II secretion system protein E [Parcubacteria group bacterium Gr01-1014_17]|nr:MAG: Type II secretion system protein E [Parcubacteria group bacterium Gr01-1014_17]
MNTLLTLMAEKSVIDKKDIPALQAEADSSGKMDETLVRHGVALSDVLASRAELFGIPAKSLEGQEIPLDVLRFIPEESALYYKFIPVGMRDGALEIGVTNPDNLEARDALNFIAGKLGMPYKLFLISGADFERVMQSYQSLSGEVTKALTELEGAVDVEGDVELGPALKESETKIIEDAPVTKIVATILHYATEGLASDIHIEPQEDRVRVRFRVDGILGTSLVLPAKVHAATVARIKILSNIRLDEKRKPQDGRFSARIAGRRIDFRVSTFPSYYGEKVVMRILDTEKGVKPLPEMGLSERNVEIIRRILKRPYGLVLLSGPTGSGKSTTLYAMLNELDRETRNVLSLEDPVEYTIPGMSQSQVRPEIGYSFATGLRSTLRQDPDIIMVGEIRDKETAQLAVQAALTGHLVFSTLHTNNAAGVVPRLIDMGVDPFLIAPTMALMIAQRLVGNINPGTGKPMPVDGSVAATIDRSFTDLPEGVRKNIPHAKEVLFIEPTKDCPKGIRGRSAVFEVIEMDKALERVILSRPTEEEITKVARAQGMLTMKEDAVLKAFRKEIPWEEVNKL